MSIGSTLHTLQAVWKRAAPSGTCPSPSDCTVAVLVFLLFTCVI